MDPAEEQMPEQVKHMIKHGIHWPRKELSKAPGKGKLTGKPQTWFKGRTKTTSSPMPGKKKSSFGY